MFTIKFCAKLKSLIKYLHHWNVLCLKRRYDDERYLLITMSVYLSAFAKQNKNGADVCP